MADIPGWQLGQELNSGGNGRVWIAHRDDGSGPFALKCLKSSKILTEPYLRFVQEIAVLRDLGDFDGVLPVIASYLPDAPSKSDRPWLAMPIANPMADSLEAVPLSTVVEAMLAVADTLARLQEQHDIAHRDIKPGNLFELDGRWLVGDFGLAHDPKRSDLTESDRPLGPRHFSPYELLINPAVADPHPADVYSLGKTLWVLATGERFPPEGPQAVSNQGFRIADSRSDPRTLALDGLVERMTRMNAMARPTKREVANELAAWLETAVSVDLHIDDELVKRLRAGLESEILATEVRGHWRNAALGSIRQFQEKFRAINETLRTIRNDAEINAQNDEQAENLLKVREFQRQSILRTVRTSRIFSGDPRRHPLEMKVAWSIELCDDGRIHINGFVIVGRSGLMSGAEHWETEDRSAPVESIEVDRIIDESISQLSELVATGLEHFSRALGPHES
jgi:serine/threonine protein kinase